MPVTRTAREIIAARPTIEGAGVRLKRAFGHAELPRFDPFLMLDEFHSDDPGDYRAGFPWHPHRGIETITYVLHGYVEHGDSLGNQGVIGPGDVQWMTAGSGIIHQEMPRESPPAGAAAADAVKPGLLWGFQLWANLPAAQKMTAPRYRDVRGADIPVVEPAGGVSVRILCGELEGVRGPVADIAIEPEYLDITLSAGSRFVRALPSEHTVFAYLVEGTVSVGEATPPVGHEHTVMFGPGDHVVMEAQDMTSRLLLISGRPLHEPVAWGGPIVMNTQEELRQAMQEYRDGTFVRDPVTGPGSTPGPRSSPQ